MGVVAGVAMAEAVDFKAGAVSRGGGGVWGVSGGGGGGVVAGMAEAVGTMDLPAFAAEDMDLLVTP
jgi:hypothetical protein